ncbi:hypothetical protein [Oceanospirillum maris]|uniref:hypothetical protein n=1 Tax=Oceanospirillum maris TaxID=64977 RepID=UPI0004809F47|nr:hypothetical protein [Oceanospirillum maris]
MTNQIKEIVIHAISQQNILLEKPVDLSMGDNSPLYCEGGQIDSLALVSILVDVESSIKAHYQADVRLADTSDLSSMESPFLTLGTLVQYTRNRLTDLGV